MLVESTAVHLLFNSPSSVALKMAKHVWPLPPDKSTEGAKVSLSNLIRFFFLFRLVFIDMTVIDNMSLNRKYKNVHKRLYDVIFLAF